MELKPIPTDIRFITVDSPLVVGFTGLAKSGKDTAAKAIASTLETIYGTKFEMLSFASPIREIGKVFGYTDEQMSNQSLKETYFGNKITNVTPRTFMQMVGTDMFRNCLDKDIWVRALESKITDKVCGLHSELISGGATWKPCKVYFITDVRFPNEAEAIRKHKGIVVRVDREQEIQEKSNEWRKHESEKAMSEIIPDCLWINDSNSALTWCSKSIGLFDSVMKEMHIEFN